MTRDKIICLVWLDDDQHAFFVFNWSLQYVTHLIIEQTTLSSFAIADDITTCDMYVTTSYDKGNTIVNFIDASSGAARHTTIKLEGSFNSLQVNSQKELLVLDNKTRKLVGFDYTGRRLYENLLCYCREPDTKCKWVCYQLQVNADDRIVLKFRHHETFRFNVQYTKNE